MNVFKLIEEHGLTLHGDIEHFAELVRADEREACAKVCLEEAQEAYHKEASYLPQGNPYLLHIAEGAKRCADSIRARGDVHASDMSQERVDETAKGKHEWVGLDDDIPGLGLVTEEFYNGMLCAEDILRKKNT